MPYGSLPPEAFWGACREDRDFLAARVYAPRFAIAPTDGIAAAGSCFAQHIGRYLRRSNARFLDVEPAPPGMLPETAASFGYGLFSARYGNVYTAAQLRQLIEDAAETRVHEAAVWETDGRWYDGLRPRSESGGLASPDEVIAQRRDHLRRVLALVGQADVFIFTLGLTEHWVDRATGLAFPTCPGTVAGRYDPDRHGFVNAGFQAVRDDLLAALHLMREMNPHLRMLLTVSPVPLTATRSGQHVLPATTYSKSVLRAVAGDVAAGEADVDYFPSYEIITGAPWAGRFYAGNLREVTEAGVDFVMSCFFGAHPGLAGAADVSQPAAAQQDAAAAEVVCEEMLLEAFRR